MEKRLKFFIKIFCLARYTNAIRCEGLRTIINNRKSLKINSPRLEVFLKENLYIELINSSNKFEFLKLYLNKLVIQNYRGAKPSTKVFIQDKQINYTKKIIVSIGINDYKDFDKLICAENDANTIMNFFVNNMGFSGQTILGKDATKSNIEKLFKTSLFNTLNTDDLLVFSYHGHGIVMNINNIDYGFLVPINSPKTTTPGDLISMNDLTNWINYLKCKHILILLDCCFSGMSLSTRNAKTLRFNPTLQKIMNKKNRIIINAGMDDQVVCDNGWGSNSPFVGAIVSYPGYKNNYGSVICLFNYLMNVIPPNYHQIPTLGKLPGDQGGDIFLAI